LLFVLSYVLIVCTVPLPPGVNPIAVDKYIYLSNSTPRLLYSRERDQVLILQVAEWTPGPLRTGAENLPPQGNDPSTRVTTVYFVQF